MIDRRLKVTMNPDGSADVEGVAYVADTPNVNGTIYQKEVLEKALAEFMKKDFRPLTRGCQPGKPRLRDLVGQVEDGKLDGAEVSLTARVYPAFVEVLEGEVAFAGSGEGESETNADGDLVVRNFKVHSIGVVPVLAVGGEREPPNWNPPGPIHDDGPSDREKLITEAARIGYEAGHHDCAEGGYVEPIEVAEEICKDLIEGENS